MNTQRESIILNTPEQISAYQHLARRGALQLETLGMRVNRGQTVYSIVKQIYGFKGSKEKVLAQLEDYIDANVMTLTDRYTPRKENTNA